MNIVATMTILIYKNWFVRIAYKSTIMWRLFVIYIEMYSLEEKIIEKNQFINFHHIFLIYCSREGSLSSQKGAKSKV
jgi:hypothetical protein